MWISEQTWQAGMLGGSNGGSKWEHREGRREKCESERASGKGSCGGSRTVCEYQRGWVEWVKEWGDVRIERRREQGSASSMGTQVGQGANRKETGEAAAAVAAAAAAAMATAAAAAAAMATAATAAAAAAMATTAAAAAMATAAAAAASAMATTAAAAAVAAMATAAAAAAAAMATTTGG